MSLNFAQEELKYYLNRMTGTTAVDIQLSVDSELERIYQGDVSFNEFDDIYKISVFQGKGTISGVNDRSILLGVYAYLRRLGCKFLKPGRENEIIPRLAINLCSVSETKVYKNRHRTVCIEGANTIENIIDMIDFLPKNGMNGYFVQFFTPYEFFERWYKHQKNPYINGKEFTVDDAKKMHQKIDEEIFKRSLIYHAVGHGWTAKAIGVEALGWHKSNEINSLIDTQYLALINGKRSFYDDIPLNTQLCYSNKLVKERLVDAIVDYALENPQVDIIHFWLGDYFNNYCECDQCKQKYPSDHYVQILNLLDKKLTMQHCKTKIAFLIYFDLLWVGKEAKIDNPDRFIMMFAPITRTFTKSYLDSLEQINDNKSEAIPKFVLNKNKFPENLKENLSFLHQWQEIFNGDSFLFDYHLMWDPFKDYTNVGLSKIIYDDMKSLQDLNLNGFISCQLQRVFYPTGQALFTMVQSLCENSTYDSIVQEYFESVYNKNANRVLKILKSITDIKIHEYARAERPHDDKEVLLSVSCIKTKIKSYIHEVIDMIKHNEISNQLESKELEILKHFLQYYQLLLTCIQEKIKGTIKIEESISFAKLLAYMLKDEIQYQPIYDGYFFHHIIKEFLEKKW
ncbi:DUF4838 domain-containing protein [Candidatus Izemoplasma sp. B36]|uniref:DUF4838 domain-containing protein n=1 Tax=Candidatus Izemoplasma sp. B36 TaxID=3242468 RepID=UPI003558BA60